MESMSSIALVTETWPPEINGVAMTLSRLTHGLSERNWQVTLVRPQQQSREIVDTHQHLLVPGLPIPGYAGLRFGLPMSRMLFKRWSEQRPDVVHIATQGPLGWAAMKVAKRLNLPVTTSFHTNFHRYCGHYGLKLISQSVASYLRKFHNQATCTMTPNEPLSQSLRQDGYQNVFTVGRGIDTALFNPARRSDALRAEWQANDMVVIYVGRIAAEKNLRGVTEAFARVQAVRPNAKMVWVGDGPQLKNMREQYPQHIFVGAKRGEELATYYASADIFLFPSLTETFGNVVLEAMSSGLAVVAYRYAAAESYIEHGKSGLLAKFGDVVDFNAQATQIASQPERMQAMRLAARTAIESVPWDEVCDQFETLIRLAAKGEPLCLPA
ncbi:MAG: glycosyltransferase family 1 protein [Methylophilales bacterium]|nr:glycosyltransferase family 1 protein [Methylophilales bacterium]